MSDEHSNDVAVHGYPPIGERGQSWEAGYDAGWVDGKKRLESQNQALQERIEELTVGLNEAIGHLTSNEWKHDASSRRRTKAVKEATRALSPTQETDPE